MRQPLLALAALLVAAFPATAAAAPVNDNYLASTTITSVDFHDAQDTSTATTQADLFNPDRNGQVFAGGPPETLICNGVGYGKTVWYDFSPPTPGGVQIDAVGFPTVVTVYKWNPQTSQITSTVRCQSSSTLSNTMLLQATIKANQNYTIQIGGVSNAGGPVDFRFQFFPDTDGDGVLDDIPDQCPRQKGTVGGCPPVVRAAPSISFNRLGGGVLQITSISVDHVLKHGVVEVRCRRCGHRVRVKARHKGSLRVRGFVGRRLSPGDFIEVRATQPKTKHGRLRFGAIGRSFRYPVTSKGLGHRIDRCLAPRTNRRQRCQ